MWLFITLAYWLSFMGYIQAFSQLPSRRYHQKQEAYIPLCNPCSPTREYHVNPDDAKYPLASLSLHIGSLKAHFSLGSDTTNLNNLEDFKQLQNLAEMPPETKKQLQTVTRQILEAFGLYEPFQQHHRSLIVNNPIYHGHQSGMVNYIKKVKGNYKSQEVINEEDGTNGDNRKSNMGKKSDGEDAGEARLTRDKILSDLAWLHSSAEDNDDDDNSFLIRKMNNNVEVRFGPDGEYHESVGTTTNKPGAATFTNV